MTKRKKQILLAMGWCRTTERQAAKMLRDPNHECSMTDQDRELTAASVAINRMFASASGDDFREDAALALVYAVIDEAVHRRELGKVGIFVPLGITTHGKGAGLTASDADVTNPQ